MYELLGGVMRLWSVLLLLVPSMAFAENTASNFFRDYDSANEAEQKELRYMMLHFYTGMYWSNSYNRHVLKQKPIYCAPPKFAMTAEQLESIVRQQAASDKVVAGAPLALAVLYAVRNVFPCP